MHRVGRFVFVSSRVPHRALWSARMRASVYHGGARAAIGAHARKQLQQVCPRTGEATSHKQPHMIFSFGFAWGDDPQNLPYTPLILQVNQWYGFLTLAPPRPRSQCWGALCVRAWF